MATRKPRGHNLSSRHRREGSGRATLTLHSCHPFLERGAWLATSRKSKQGEDIQQHRSYLTLQRHWPRRCGASRASTRDCAQISPEMLPCTAQSQVSPRQIHNLAGCSLGQSRNFKATTPGIQGSGLSPEEQGQEGAEPGSPAWGTLA